MADNEVRLYVEPDALARGVDYCRARGMDLSALLNEFLRSLPERRARPPWPRRAASGRAGPRRPRLRPGPGRDVGGPGGGGVRRDD